MLNLTPRRITLSILLFFSLLIAVRQFTFAIASPDSSPLGQFLISILMVDSEAAKDFQAEKAQAIEDLKSRSEWLEKKLEALSWIERVDYDFHLTSHFPGKIHPDVEIIEVNEDSLRDLGQFPFSRSAYKSLIEKLELAGAKVVAFDITFPEEERSALKQMQAVQQELTLREGFDSPAVQFLTEKVNTLDMDEALANALSTSKIPVVLGFAFSTVYKRAGDKIQAERDEKIREIFRQYDIRTGQYHVLKAGTKYRRVTSLQSKDDIVPVVSIEKLVGSLSAASSIGNFTVEADADSIIRKVPMVVQYEQFVLGALSLRALASYYGEDLFLDNSEGVAVRGLADGKEGKLFVPLLPSGDILLRYYGGEHEFPYTEFSHVINGSIPEEELKKKFGGKMVFVGVTAQGLKDIRATPYSRDYPGVETHATIASNVLSQHFLLQDNRYFWTGYLLTWFCGLIVSLLVYRLHPFWSLGATITLTVLAHELTVLSFNKGLVTPFLLPAFSSFTIFFSGIIYRYMTEERERKKVRSVLSRYVSTAVVEEILKDQTKLRLGGQKKELTVMFVDLVGFTKIAEHMDAAFVTQLLNEYFTRMTSIIFKHKGTLDKFMGDSIMCFWGAPHETPEHAKLACAAALEMQHELARINNEWRTKHSITIENRLGIHTGDMAVGNMGSNEIFSYTVMGDNVNLGSRLEGVNTVYGTKIILSAASVAKAGDGFLFRPLDRVQVKGKEDSVEILELVGEKAEREPEWIHAFRTGLKHYQAGEWDDAESAFGACLTLKPGDGPAQVFIDRIRDFRIVAPDEWSGVWKLVSK